MKTFIYVRCWTGFEPMWFANSIWDIPGRSEILEIFKPDFPQNVTKPADIIVSLSNHNGAESIVGQIKNLTGVSEAYIVTSENVPRPN